MRTVVATEFKVLHDKMSPERRAANEAAAKAMLEKMPTKIRILNHTNSHLMKNVAADVFDHDIQPQYLSAFLDDPRHILSFATDNKIVVGIASAFEYFHPDKPQQLFVNEVGVAPHYRRQGIGRSLVEALLATARERGCAYAWLGTEVDNDSGRACFSSVPGVSAPEEFLLYEWELDT